MENSLIIIMAYIISLGFIAGLVFLITWVFGWPFTWEIVFKTWILFLIINIFREDKKKEGEK